MKSNNEFKELVFLWRNNPDEELSKLSTDEYLDELKTAINFENYFKVLNHFINNEDSGFNSEIQEELKKNKHILLYAQSLYNNPDSKELNEELYNRAIINYDGRKKMNIPDKDSYTNNELLLITTISVCLGKEPEILAGEYIAWDDYVEVYLDECVVVYDYSNDVYPSSIKYTLMGICETYYFILEEMDEDEE